MAVLDSSTAFSTSQNAFATNADVVSSNSLDMGSGLASGYDLGPGNMPNIFTLINTAFSGGTSVQIILQSDTTSSFGAAPLEFPLTGLLYRSVIVGSIASTGVLTVGTLTSGTVQVGALVTGGTTPSGIFITGQLSGTPGGVGTYSTNCTVVVAAPTGTNSAYANRQINSKFPGKDLKRYARLIYRNVGANTTGVVSSCLTMDPVVQAPVFPSGFSVA